MRPLLPNFSAKPTSKHRHQSSLESFMRNIKKQNHRSQRYNSPVFATMLPYSHTSKSGEKSRSRSQSKKSKSVVSLQKQKVKIDKILNSQTTLEGDKKSLHTFLEEYGVRLRKTEKYLKKKNQIGHYLCKNFNIILKDVVSLIIVTFETQIKEIERKINRKAEEKLRKEIRKLKNQNEKLGQKLSEAMQKLENNSEIIHQIRMLNQVNVDDLYGKKLLNTRIHEKTGYGNRERDDDDGSSPPVQQTMSERLLTIEVENFDEIEHQIRNEKERKGNMFKYRNPKQRQEKEEEEYPEQGSQG